MGRFKNHIAFFLLLLFVRVLIPEASVLALHAHEHTQDVQEKMDTGFKLDKKHSHCHTDNLFNAPFTPVTFSSLEKPMLAFQDTYSAAYSWIWKFTFPNNTDSRGPPAV